MDTLSAISFSNAVAFAVVLLLLLPIIVYQYLLPRKRGTVPMTGLEYLVRSNVLGGRNPKTTRAVVYSILSLGLAILWAGPEYRSTWPVFLDSEPEQRKRYVVVLDISPSMNLPYDVLGFGEDDLQAGDEGVTRFELAREALVSFLERFREHEFGLVLFSTEPLLARWPSVDTKNNFVEVLESIRRGSGTQLSAYSSLTNIDKGLIMARKAAGGTDAAIILISDAEDHLENIGTAVTALRQSGLRLYVIGVGISDQVVETLSGQFAGDPGFRIFRAISEEEMAEAYETVGAVELAPVGKTAGHIYRTDLQWLAALAFAVLAAILFWAGETRFHTTFAPENEGTGNEDKRRGV